MSSLWHDTRNRQIANRWQWWVGAPATALTLVFAVQGRWLWAVGWLIVGALAFLRSGDASAEANRNEMASLGESGRSAVRKGWSVGDLRPDADAHARAQTASDIGRRRSYFDRLVPPIMLVWTGLFLGLYLTR